jgi:hypothetical protein
MIDEPTLTELLARMTALHEATEQRLAQMEQERKLTPPSRAAAIQERKPAK